MTLGSDTPELRETSNVKTVNGVNWGNYYESLAEPAAGTTATLTTIAKTTAAPSATPATSNYDHLFPSPNYGMVQTGDNSWSYNPLANPMLTSQTSSTNLNGTLVTQTTAPTVTQSAAQQFASALGGTVVPMQTPWATTAPVYGIQLANGAVVDATAIANILGDNGMYGNDAVKAGEIAKLMGVTYDPSMVGLTAALRGGTNANLTTNVNTPFGQMSAPVLTPADGRGAPVTPVPASAT